MQVQEMRCLTPERLVDRVRHAAVSLPVLLPATSRSYCGPGHRRRPVPASYECAVDDPESPAGSRRGRRPLFRAMSSRRPHERRIASLPAPRCRAGPQAGETPDRACPTPRPTRNAHALPDRRRCASQLRVKATSHLAFPIVQVKRVCDGFSGFHPCQASKHAALSVSGRA